MITPAQKAELLERIDNLQRAVKIARQKANEQEVQKTRVANKIFDYVNAPLK
jgi:hypothetical protein